MEDNEIIIICEGCQYSKRAPLGSIAICDSCGGTMQSKESLMGQLN